MLGTLDELAVATLLENALMKGDMFESYRDLLTTILNNESLADVTAYHKGVITGLSQVNRVLGTNYDTLPWIEVFEQVTENHTNV